MPGRLRRMTALVPMIMFQRSEDEWGRGGRLRRVSALIKVAFFGVHVRVFFALPKH